MMAFETVHDATRLWIKGREFTVARLLGDAYKGQADKYQGGALAIFRLAPQDYHRFHSPVSGTIGPMTYIAGEYYTVNVSHLHHAASMRLMSLSAPSCPDNSRYLRRERPQDRAHRQSPLRTGDGSLHRRNDGRLHTYDCARRGDRGTRRRIWILCLRYDALALLLAGAWTDNLHQAGRPSSCSLNVV
jgi:hypothetical protein